MELIPKKYDWAIGVLMLLITAISLFIISKFAIFAPKLVDYKITTSKDHSGFPREYGELTPEQREHMQEDFLRSNKMLSARKMYESCIASASFDVSISQSTACREQAYLAKEKFYECGKEKVECKEKWGPVIEEFSKRNCKLPLIDSQIQAKVLALKRACHEQYFGQQN